MKYTLIINQKGIVDSGLYGKDKTDLIDWVIIDYLHDWQTRGFDNAKKVIIGEKFFLWINYKYLIKELPMIGINTKKGISDRIKKLRELDLIETHQTKDNSLYVRITAKAINVNYDQKNSEQNPPVNPQVNTPVNPRVNTPVNPRVNSTNSNTNKQNTNKQREKETSPAAAQNGKPATQPTANNKFLSLDFFEKNLTENHPLIKGATALKITPETKRKIKAIPPEHRQRVINAHQNYKKSDMVKDGAINHLHTWLEEWEIWEPSATAPGNTGDKISIYFRDSNKTENIFTTDPDFIAKIEHYIKIIPEFDSSLIIDQLKSKNHLTLAAAIEQLETI